MRGSSADAWRQQLSQLLHAVPSATARSSASSAPSRSSNAQPQPPQPLPRSRVGRAAPDRARGRLLGQVDRADVLVDARREAVGGGAARRPLAPIRAPRGRPPRACPPARTRASSAAAPPRSAARRRARRSAAGPRARIRLRPSPAARRPGSARRAPPAGSGFEKSTNFMLPAGTVRTPWLNCTRAHCCTLVVFRR